MQLHQQMMKNQLRLENLAGFLLFHFSEISGAITLHPTTVHITSDVIMLYQSRRNLSETAIGDG